ncbi:MAG: hypothetical protein GY729_21795 [Desulfobacteraceae bacterium]|nr:hypothetical protein [Desulfobacteraceae bacterium]
MKEKEKKIKKQWGLRVFFGVVMILIIILVEMIAIHPSGIYSYQKGYKNFKAGIPKERVLRHIDHMSTIRTIRVCDPVFVVQKTSRRKLEMSDELAASDHWICYDKKGLDYLIRFKNDKLEKVFIQRVRFKKKDFSPLFTQCNPKILKDIDFYLQTQDRFKVFYDNGS